MLWVSEDITVLNKQPLELKTEQLRHPLLPSERRMITLPHASNTGEPECNEFTGCNKPGGNWLKIDLW